MAEVLAEEVERLKLVSGASEPTTPAPSVVVIDCGSAWTRVGFSGDHHIRFPSVVGKLKHPGIMVGMLDPATPIIGHEAEAKQGLLNLRSPLDDQGVVTRWDDLEHIWRHAFFGNDFCPRFSEERVEPELHPVVLTEATLNPRANTERMVRLMLETFEVPAVHVTSRAVCALSASGRSTGVLFECGEAVSNVVAIYQGNVIPHSIHSGLVSGQDLTEHMRQLLTERGYSFNTRSRRSDLSLARDVKERLSFVALDYAENTKTVANSSDLQGNFELPDGQEICIDKERFTCPEALFLPSLVGKEGPGVPECIFDTVSTADNDDIKLRQELFANVVLSGGRYAQHSPHTCSLDSDSDASAFLAAPFSPDLPIA